MPGPPPKDPTQRRRRNASPGFKLLPHEGREGPPPEWPLTGSPTVEEWKRWCELWRLPQAVEWERMQDYGTVALYVRTFCAAAGVLVGAPPDPRLLAEVRQLDAKIGVSPKAMRDLRWETDEARPEPDEDPESSAEPVDPKTELKRRVRAVD